MEGHSPSDVGSIVAVHLTPDQLADEIGVRRVDVVATCIKLGVPIYQGRIDKTLFEAVVAGGQESFEEALEEHTPDWRLH